MSPVQEFQTVLEDAWVRWAPSWRGYALRLTRDPADADDVVQDAVTRTLRARPSLPDHRAAHGYVMQAVRTSALKLYRSRERSLRRPTRDPDVGPRPLPTALEIALYRERRAERDELIERMRRELERLPEKQRQAVELFVLREEPLKLREVAEIQDAAISTVHSRLQAAIRKLAARLG